MRQFDLVIRGGTVSDGWGGELFEADVGITGDRIAAVGPNLAAGAEEIDARGRLVTPGFIDVHAHYDGQASWASRLEPSTRHGATTVVTGNCGVGFAPCRAADRDALVKLMEGVEDIPGTALHEGLPWNWESFPDYLEALDTIPHDADIATLVPHGALRVFVMGERGLAREKATPADIARMRDLMQQAISAGAIGMGTSRTIIHRTIDGALTPMYGAAYEELIGICSGFEGRAMFQLVSDWDEEAAEFELLRAAVRAGAASASYSLLQWEHRSDQWRNLIARTDAANADGIPVWGQTLSRPMGGLIGLDATFHPFILKPSYQKIAHLPLKARVQAMREPELRRRLLTEQDVGGHMIMPHFRAHATDRIFVMGEFPNYAPTRAESVAAGAEAAGVDVLEWFYDKMLEDGGRMMFFMPVANFLGASIDPIGEMLTNPHVVSALGDGGAHVGSICDASSSTFLLGYWARDRRLLSLPQAVAKLSGAGAELTGLADRGRLAPGLKADINVIDLDRLAARRPVIVHDLPAGGKRLTQEARGYEATILSGQIVARDDEPTDALPGRVVRGRQSAPRVRA